MNNRFQAFCFSKCNVYRYAEDDETQAFKNAAAPNLKNDNFQVGAKPLDEKMLSQVMLQLLQNHTRGVPAAGGWTR